MFVDKIILANQKYYLYHSLSQVIEKDTFHNLIFDTLFISCFVFFVPDDSSGHHHEITVSIKFAGVKVDETDNVLHAYISLPVQVQNLHAEPTSFGFLSRNRTYHIAVPELLRLHEESCERLYNILGGRRGA